VRSRDRAPPQLPISGLTFRRCSDASSREAFGRFARHTVAVRIYPFWYLRFSGIPIVAALIVIAVREFVMAGFAATFPSGYAVFGALVLLAIALRALVGGVELTEAHVIVRNPFSTRAVPWERVTRVESSVMWWNDDRGREHATPLIWFGEPVVAPRSLKQHNAEAVAAIRARLHTSIQPDAIN
jgi:hypothetical protein